MNAPGESSSGQGDRDLRRRRRRAMSRATAVVESNVPDVATVADATVKGARTGEATLLVRYQGNLATMPVTVLNPKPGFAWKAAAAEQLHRPRDRRQTAAAEDPAVARGGRCRRSCAASRSTSPASCPTPEEVRAFLADASKTKRAARIDKLIASPAFVDHWTLKWGDLLQNNRKYLGEKGAYEFREWIRESIAQNKPYDRMVREMLAARGSSVRESRGEFLPRDARRQADHGEDHPGLPRRPHGVRAVPRPSVRALDAEPVLRDGGVLLAGRTPAGLRGRRGDHLRPAAGFRHEASEGRPRDEPQVHPAGALRRHGRARGCDAPHCVRGVADGEGQPVLREIDGQSRVELLLRARHHRPGGRHPRVESARAIPRCSMR